MVPSGSQAGFQNSRTRVTAGITHGKSAAMVSGEKLGSCELSCDWESPKYCLCTVAVAYPTGEDASTLLLSTMMEAQSSRTAMQPHTGSLQTHMPGSPMESTKDTKRDQSGQTHFFTWIVRWGLMLETDAKDTCGWHSQARGLELCSF